MMEQVSEGSYRRWRGYLLVLTAFILLLGCFRERIVENAGMGWDGVQYGRAARDLPAFMTTRPSDYIASRLLPSALIWSFTGGLGLPLGHTATVIVFLVVNVLAVLASGWLWLRIARRWGFPPALVLLGGAGLLWSYPTLKVATFYPVLGDVLGLALSTAQLYLYATGRPLGLACLTLAGAFTFPPLLHSGMLLLWGGNESRSNTGSSSPVSTGLSVVGALLYILWSLQVWSWLQSGRIPLAPNLTTPVTAAWLYPSLLVTAIYLGVTLRSLLGSDRDLGALLRGLVSWRCLLALSPWLAHKVLLTQLPTTPGGYGFSEFFLNLTRQSLTFPGASQVSHLAYFGPLLWLLILKARQLPQALRALGPGFRLVLLFYALLAIGSESRQFIGAVPFLICAACWLWREHRWSPAQIAGLLAYQLLLSRFWVTIQVGPRLLDIRGPFWERYLLMLGPWMTEAQYWTQLLLAGLSGLTVGLLVLSFSRHRG